MHLCMSKDGNIYKLKCKSKNVHLFVKYTKKVYVKQNIFLIWLYLLFFPFKRHNLYGFFYCQNLSNLKQITHTKQGQLSFMLHALHAKKWCYLDEPNWNT